MSSRHADNSCRNSSVPAHNTRLDIILNSPPRKVKKVKYRLAVITL